MTTLHPFQKLIAENKANGLPHADAVRQARSDDPAGFQSWLDSHNREHGGAFAPERLRKQPA